MGRASLEAAVENLAINLANSERWAPDGAPVDRLEQPAWLQDYAGQLGWRVPLAAPALEPLRRELRELRPVIRRQFDRLATAPGEVTDAMLADINRLIGATPIECRLERADGGVRRRERPAADGLAALAPQLGLALAELLTGYEPVRVKVCPNPLCRWVFYDETRGNIQRWCCYSCGNTAKVRRFRERQRGRRT